MKRIWFLMLTCMLLSSATASAAWPPTSLDECSWPASAPADNAAKTNWERECTYYFHNMPSEIGNDCEFNRQPANAVEANAFATDQRECIYARETLIAPPPNTLNITEASNPPDFENSPDFSVLVLGISLTVVFLLIMQSSQKIVIKTG